MLPTFASAASAPESRTTKNISLKIGNTTVSGANLTVPAGKLWKILGILVITPASITTGPKLQGIVLSGVTGTSSTYVMASRRRIVPSGGGATIINFIGGHPQINSSTAATSANAFFGPAITGVVGNGLSVHDYSDYLAILSPGQTLTNSVAGSGTGTLRVLYEEIDM